MSCMFGVPRFRDHGECTLGFVMGLPETLNPKPETLNPTDTKRTSLSDKPVGGAGSMNFPTPGKLQSKFQESAPRGRSPP